MPTPRTEPTATMTGRNPNIKPHAEIKQEHVPQFAAAYKTYINELTKVFLSLPNSPQDLNPNDLFARVERDLASLPDFSASAGLNIRADLLSPQLPMSKINQTKLHDKFSISKKVLRKIIPSTRSRIAAWDKYGLILYQWSRTAKLHSLKAQANATKDATEHNQTLLNAFKDEFAAANGPDSVVANWSNGKEATLRTDLGLTDDVTVVNIEKVEQITNRAAGSLFQTRKASILDAVVPPATANDAAATKKALDSILAEYKAAKKYIDAPAAVLESYQNAELEKLQMTERELSTDRAALKDVTVIDEATKLAERRRMGIPAVLVAGTSIEDQINKNHRYFVDLKQFHLDASTEPDPDRRDAIATSTTLTAITDEYIAKADPQLALRRTLGLHDVLDEDEDLKDQIDKINPDTSFMSYKNAFLAASPNPLDPAEIDAAEAKASDKVVKEYKDRSEPQVAIKELGTQMHPHRVDVDVHRDNAGNITGFSFMHKAGTLAIFSGRAEREEGAARKIVDEAAKRGWKSIQIGGKFTKDLVRQTALYAALKEPRIRIETKTEYGKAEQYTPDKKFWDEYTKAAGKDKAEQLRKNWYPEFADKDAQNKGAIHGLGLH